MDVNLSATFPHADAPVAGVVQQAPLAGGEARAALRALDLLLAGSLGISLASTSVVPDWLQTCEVTVAAIQGGVLVAGLLARKAWRGS